MSVENASLSMTNVTVSQNQTNLATSSKGGGINYLDSDPNDGITVSAILNQVSILNNTTYYTGGGMNINGSVTVTLSDVTIRGNETIDTYGGGIAAYDANNALTIHITNNSTFQDNLANGALGNGGGISTNGSLSVTDSSFINNSASLDGGAISAFGNGSAVTLTNATLSGNQSDGGAGMHAANISSLTITDSNITNNQAQTYGGGLYYGDPNGHTTIQNSVISGNQAITGGGGGISTSGDLSIEDTTISGNASLYDGGGIFYYSDNKSFSLNRVTISGNSSINNAGGLYLLNTGTGSVTNSTVSGNSSTSGVGGVYANAATSVLFNHVTIAGNTSANYVGGLTTSGVNVSMNNSIIADNTGGGAYASFPDCLATIQSQDYNLIEKVDSSCGLTGITSHNITGQDPKLDTLKNNGGSTLTMNLLPGSPAIDPAGNTSCIAEDQRGNTRPQDGDNNSTATCDIGALEVSGTPAVHVTRLDVDPASASSVRFLVRFTEPVNGVDKTAPFADFELSPIGPVGTSILSVTGSGAEYTVTVNTGTGNGSIGLDVLDNDSITSIASGEPLGGTGIETAITPMENAIP
ncbi:MAG: hypothetical protein IPJ46_08920 [Anaerolineales bacterium]|nr:hypothetical protein [Anaerolineales bacterium]